jgi:hypothetical protein
LGEELTQIPAHSAPAIAFTAPPVSLRSDLFL